MTDLTTLTPATDDQVSNIHERHAPALRNLAEAWGCAGNVNIGEVLQLIARIDADRATISTANKAREEAEYALKRFEEAVAKQPDWEKLWEEQSNRAEAAEAQLRAIASGESVVVPREPTVDMRIAGWKAMRPDYLSSSDGVWTAMLAAGPAAAAPEASPPARGGDGELLDGPGPWHAVFLHGDGPKLLVRGAGYPTVAEAMAAERTMKPVGVISESFHPLREADPTPQQEGGESGWLFEERRPGDPSYWKPQISKRKPEPSPAIRKVEGLYRAAPPPTPARPADAWLREAARRLIDNLQVVRGTEMDAVLGPTYLVHGIATERLRAALSTPVASGEVVALAREEAAHERTIEQRDKAEEALSQAYYIITGRSPEWSNLFGTNEALEEIEDACALLRAAISTPAEGQGNG